MDTFNTSSTKEFVNSRIWDQHYEACVPITNYVSSRGFWFKDDPTNHALPIFMIQLILMFIISQSTRLLLSPLKQPKVICNLLVSI